MRRAFSFFIGTLVGGIIGAAAALLLAPFSGEEMRGQIDSRFEPGHRHSPNS